MSVYVVMSQGGQLCPQIRGIYATKNAAESVVQQLAYSEEAPDVWIEAYDLETT